MILELNLEQLKYLKGLESDKKKKEFLLTALLENINSVKTVKISEFPSKTYSENESVTLDMKAPFFLDETTEVFEKFLKFDELENDYSLEEKNHLCWIYNRLLLKYKENPLFDYMQKLRGLALEYDNSPNRQELEKAFNASREYHHVISESVLQNKLVYATFEDYFKTLEK